MKCHGSVGQQDLYSSRRLTTSRPHFWSVQHTLSRLQQIPTVCFSLLSLFCWFSKVRSRLRQTWNPSEAFDPLKVARDYVHPWKAQSGNVWLSVWPSKLMITCFATRCTACVYRVRAFPSLINPRSSSDITCWICLLLIMNVCPQWLKDLLSCCRPIMIRWPLIDLETI